MKIVVSEKAKSDLFQLYLYVAPRNSAAADAIVERINRRFEQLVRFPFIGRPRASLAPGIAASLLETI
jgi:plasmid stabilization system protein ParE